MSTCCAYWLCKDLSNGLALEIGGLPPNYQTSACLRRFITLRQANLWITYGEHYESD
jgi:hypothetical protein